ncbi:GNAT family N-acetyltransferase [Flavobacterium ardleyense]|uniref:GNAT family N-acetyltransferase n=1 Tax=Flavobacterium ardleyense TaxID=2038737 RepID=A0ABW5ZAY9_9FLAO
MIYIKKISSAETYLVRQEVLRKGKSIETCYFDGDDDVTTAHFGLFQDERIIGVVSIFKATATLFTESDQFQIRGMAVLEEFQGKGFGERLLKEAEEYCWTQHAKVIWFNARESAVAFYKKSNYKILGDSFNIPDVGIHFVMHKKD